MGNAKRKSEASAAGRRRLAITLTVIVLLAGGVAAYLLVDRANDDSPDGSEAPVGNMASEFEGGSTSLLYADFDQAQNLHAFDLETGDRSKVGELPVSGDTEAAPGSHWLSILAPEDHLDDIRPALYVYNAETDEEFRIGVRDGPRWSARGDRLAFMTPENVAQCGEDECRGDKVVSVIDPSAPSDARALTDPGPYSLSGWAGNHLLVSNESTPGVPILQSISLDGEVKDLPIEPRDFWGASPDGRYVIGSGAAGTRFYEMDDGEVTESGPDIDIPEGSILGSGAWAHDSSQVAALVVSDDGGLEMVRFSPEDPTPQPIDEGGNNSRIRVMWTPENDAIVFSRLARNELEAVHCEVEDPDTCEVLFSWTLGIALLRIE